MEMPEQQFSAEYIRGFTDARRTLKAWFHEAFAQMDNAFNLDLAMIPEDPGIAPLPEHFKPDIVGQIP